MGNEEKTEKIKEEDPNGCSCFLQDRKRVQ